MSVHGKKTAVEDVDAESKGKAADDVDQHKRRPLKKRKMQFCECLCATERMIDLGFDPDEEYLPCQCLLCGPLVNGVRQCTFLVVSWRSMCGNCREHAGS